MEFEFATATRILFGPGKLSALAPLLRPLGASVLVVVGRASDRVQPLMGLLEAERLAAILFQIPGEPTVQDVQRGTELARRERSDLVIGFGGGSAMDAAKAIAALLTNSGALLDYLEVIGRAQPLSNPSASCITIPTTAGTGAEVTRNAVLASPEHRFKVSLRSPLMLPKMAVVDPELTRDLPPHLTAVTGLDALTQLIEPYVSPRANPMTDGFCTEGLSRVARSLRRAFHCGSDPRAREDMALASLLSGLALANAGLGAVHGFAAPLGGMSSAAHGALCAAVLPHAMEINIRALHQRQPESASLERYAAIARLLTGSPAATAADGLTWVQELCGELKVSPLRALGVQLGDFPELIEKAAKASSMKANPIVLTPEELREILEKAFDS